MQSQTDMDNKGDEFLLFNDEEDESSKNKQGKTRPWKILVVDDDEDVHILTRLVLRGYEFDGEKITLLSAFSGQETRKIMIENPDVAIILLDVIMEDEYTGLELVKHIREELNNRKVRIILRTGQPGGALERKVVSTYEIDDYKTKTELTSDKLFTSITTALRAYRDIAAMERTGIGLLKIVNNLPHLFSTRSFGQLSEKILQSLTFLLAPDSQEDSFPTFSSFFAVSDNNDFRIIAANGEFKNKIRITINDVVSDTILEELKKAAQLKTDIIQDELYIKFLRLDNHIDCIICLKTDFTLTKEEKELVSIFLDNAKLALNHCYHLAGSLSM